MNSKAKFTRTGIETVNHMEFFRGIIKAFKEQRHVDVWLKAGDQTDAIPAHKLILAAKSKVFRNILETDDCKASPKETITLSEMTKGELETFLEFMYNGSLPDKKLVQHVHSLYQAADKYEIPYLQDICRKQLIDSMNTSNAFDLLELAKIHSDEIFEDSLSEFITRHMEEISFSSKFMSFVESNPALAVQTIRRHFDKLRNDVPK
ncbi:putative BTB/POZ domain-containing protein At2g40440 [Eutrema salsugineum]|uniref:putative BTB/POZ domain-containing protein At2g40440 n=1 Tax=Eutrema salsugineum TaxID=72664 RepID=UPI000CED6E4B|nr:putative BTB/POZ domain-containing protein At2g40440 [Eutrema salsugineum]